MDQTGTLEKVESPVDGRRLGRTAIPSIVADQVVGLHRPSGSQKQFENAAEMLNKFAANYGSMTDDAAKDILKDWFKLRDARNDTMEKYAKQMGRALPPTKVLQWVQIENKLNALLDVQAASVIPVSR